MEAETLKSEMGARYFSKPQQTADDCGTETGSKTPREGARTGPAVPTAHCQAGGMPGSEGRRASWCQLGGEMGGAEP